MYCLFTLKHARKVLQSMAKMDIPKPVAVKEQYKSAWKKRDHDGPVASEPKAKKCKAKGAKKQEPSSCSRPDMGAYTPKLYSSKRIDFLNKLKEEGVSHRDACEQWNNSDDKKCLLKDLSVSELIRRRFAPKGTAANPYAS